MAGEELLICEVCGKTNEEDPTVSERPCAYDEEINDAERLEVICDSCEHEHIMDI